jgi:hypothetical protein
MINTNFYSAGLATQRANQAIFDAYQSDLLDRADVYEICVNALEALCMDGTPIGRDY